MISILQVIEAYAELEKEQTLLIRGMVEVIIDNCDDLKVLEISFCLVTNLIRKHDI